MYSKVSLIALAVVVPATASPIVGELGTRISFQKRNALSNSDGMFDHAKAIQQVVRDHNKHRANLRNLEQNAGRDAFNEGAEVRPLMAYPAHALERRQSEALTDEAHDEYWAGNITVGTSAQNFFVDFDTGSSDLWFPSINCTQSACANKHKYNARVSSTSKHTNSNFTLHYGDGSAVSGPVWTDTVNIAGLSVHDQAFSAVTNLSDSFGPQANDGILGLAYQSLSDIRMPPFVNTAKAQGAIKQAEFGFKIAQSGSELYIGGTDASQYSGDIEYHNVVGSTGYWQIGSGKLTIGSTTISSDIKTIIDSGTTIVYGPPDMVAKLYQNIPGAAVYDENSGFYSFPCNNVPSNIAFSWGGKQWTISPQNFNRGRVDKQHCIGAIAAQNLGLGNNVWLVGDSFMKNVYSAFSFEKNAVGFATLK
ncbi:protease [Dichomitus squalens]|uniref:Protease n=1 Tax=Dichomitus squalens TaxID=114155 RepID=A0A4Q9PUK8_9APHY|nr:protease [Dichomitus squalens]TBU58237.1 protease [Dichomitus squalens]